MKPLKGYRVMACGTMARRPLARLLASFGADIVDDATPATEVSFVIDDQVTPDTGWPEDVIRATVTPFGATGPRRHWKGSELVASAAAGTLRLTGDPDRPPVREALDACTFHADMAAAAGLMAAHVARLRTGQGQGVDVSVQQVAFSRNVNGLLTWQFDQRKVHRAGGALNYGKASVRCIWKLKDGWCFHSLMTGRFGAPANQALSDWMDEVGVENPLRGVDWISYNRSTLAAETRAIWENAIDAFFLTRIKAEILGEGRRRGINACVVATPDDVRADAHLAARAFFDADGWPTRFVRFTEGPERSDTATPLPVAVTRKGPLAGLKVLDFSWALVGGISTKILGDLGAEVIKVESRTRPCLSRIDVQVQVSAAGNFDDKPWFAHLNSSKKSLALNMKSPESRRVLEPLIEWADVVVENFSPGTMAKLGLDYDSLKARNPSLIMVSGSVFGQTGPLAEDWGVDGTGGALSGRTYMTGWPDRDPVIPGAVPFGDAIVPYVMAAATCVAVAHRHETGRGAHIDASMYEICVQQMYDAFGMDHPQRMGNAEAGMAYQDVLAASGEDRWVAISARTESDLARLNDLTGGDIAGWVAAREDHAAVELLQAHAIAAAVVQDSEDLMERDPQMAACGALIDLEHAVLGRFGHMATPVRFSRDVPEPFRAPSIGEHSREIALSLCGLTEAEFSALDGAGVFK